jgi:hypothetical protein
MNKYFTAKSTMHKLIMLKIKKNETIWLKSKWLKYLWQN